MKVLLLGRISESRQAIHHMLTARGHDVIVTDNRDLFWAEYIRDVFPLLFLDLSIAGYPELHLCRHIRAFSGGNRNLVIVYGLRGQEVHADLLIDAGVDEYLSIDGSNQEDLDNRIILFEHHARLATIRHESSIASQAVYERLFYHLTTAPVAIIEWDRELRVMHWSQEAVRLFGWRAGDIVGKSAMDWPFIDEADAAQAFIALSALVDGMDDRQSVTRLNITSSGERLLVEWHTSVLRDVSGHFVSAMTFVIDVTQHEEQHVASLAAERRWQTIVEQASDLVFVLTQESTVLYASPSVERAIGAERVPLPGRSVFDLVHPDDHTGLRSTLSELTTLPGSASIEIDVRILHSDGGWREVTADLTYLPQDPAGDVVLMVARDVSPVDGTEPQREQQGFFDALTGLPSHDLFLNRVAHALARVERKSVSVAVLDVGVIHVEHVNNTLAQATSDAILTALARLLLDQQRPGDTISRLDGDEFLILLEDVSSSAEAVGVASRIIDALADPLVLAEHDVLVTASIGIAFAGRAMRSPESLLQAAGIALQRARSSELARYVVYDEGISGEEIERQELLADIHAALERSQLVIRYQPEVDLSSNAVTRLEALVFWQHPLAGLIPPDELQTLASESGLLATIGNWALAEACKSAATWKIPQRQAEQPAVSVNVSERTFHQPQFVEMVRAILADTGLDPAYLKLEVVESAIVRGDSRTILHLSQLNDLGVRIVIDDFGSGNSPLDKLAQLTVETIKIDGTFVSGEHSLSNNVAILRAVTSLAHNLGMSVAAKGIESLEQKLRVTSAGCDRGQGDFLYPPVNAGDVLALLQQIEP